MIETKEKKIGDCVYMVTQLPARRALRLKAKLIKLFGASLTQIILTASEPEEKKPEEMEPEELMAYQALNAVDKYRVHELRKTSIVKGVQLLAQSLDDKTFDELCMEILQGVRMDGMELNSGTIDHAFAGKLMELYSVIYFVLEVNYADFFGLSNIGSQLQDLNPQQVGTKKTYTYQ